MFKRSQNRYGDTPPAETPYQRARQVWDERIGSARVQAMNWRLMALSCLGLSGFLAAALVWQAAQGRITPYVVEVDRYGSVQGIAPATTPYNPTDAQIAAAVSRFITDVRSLSIDPIVVRKNWLDAYDFATDRAAETLNAFARVSDPFKAVGQRSVSVEVTSVVRASDTSFQVKWTERKFQNGHAAKTERWTGILTIVVRQPISIEILRKNPLGIYVHGLDWSRELTPGEPQ
jgi:type IV secretion system protein TrbF